MTRVFAAVLLIGAVLAGACAPAAPAASSPTGNQPKKGGTLILVRAGEVTNLDPHKVPAFTSARVFELVYSYLMRLDENLAVQPDLAESMPTTSADGKQVEKLNQREATKDGFRSIGTFRFDAAQTAEVVLSNAGTDGHVIVDAVQLIAVP